MDLKCHVYNIRGVPNMRDIGGYRTKDGRKTKHGRFIRSTALAALDKNGEAELQRIGIDCVIDLRSTMERINAPDVIEGSDMFNFAHIPMLDYISSNFASGDFTGFPSSMTDMYVGLLENSENSFKAVFDLFADERFENYLFHCTAGKDRTGVTAMLLLGLAGVDDETIIEDYSYTRNLLPMTALDPAAVSLPRYLFESEPETMRETLEYVYDNYGCVAEYLKSIGIDERKQESVLKKLL